MDDEPIIETLRWTDLYDIHILENFLMRLKYFSILEMQIDNEFQQTTLEGIKTYKTQNLDKTFEIVPNQIKILPSKNLEFFTTRVFKLYDFPQIINFVSKYCSYIYDFIIDQKVETIEIGVDRLIKRSDTYENLIDKFKEFELIKNWINQENNQNEATPFILAALIQKFYQQRSLIFNLNSTTLLSRIKNNIEHVNSLLDNNIELLKNYKINQDTDPCICICNSRARKFEFLDNSIFKSCNDFGIYSQNLDIKFLSYISCTGLA